jgi:hypothetical protein
VIDHFQKESWVLVFIELAVIVTTVIIILEAWSVVSKLRSGKAEDKEAPASDG